MDTKKLLAISKKARQERKQEKEKKRQERLQKIEDEELMVEEMLKNQPIKVREKQETAEDNDTQIEKAQDRLEVLKKIEEYEREGKFDVDVEEDPPTIVLTPENIDYLAK